MTKTSQEVHLDKQITLLDCPGIVVNNSDEETVSNIILRNCVRLEQIEDPIAPVEMLLKVCLCECGVSCEAVGVCSKD